jgi:hypothetical protein
MSYIDHFVMVFTGTPDFDEARKNLDEDEDYDLIGFVDEIQECYENDMDPDDGTEKVTLSDGTDAWHFEYHNGGGDGGSQDIVNYEWVRSSYPEIWTALNIRVEKFNWSAGIESVLV